MSPYRIDVHHHIIPPAVTDIFNTMGITHIGGVPVPHFDIKQTIAVMERSHTQTAIVCLSDAADAFTKESDATMISRASNEYYAELKTQYSGRFGAFATLPLPHVDAAVQEALYALDTLKLDGVMLLSNSGGVYLGDPQLDPLMEELNRRHAVAFVHPGNAPKSPALPFPGFLLDFMFDTTRAMTNMIFHNIPKRYPHIRFIFAHMGGTTPYLAERITLGLLNERRQKSLLPIEKVVNAASHIVPLEIITEKATQVQSTLSSFYYDTALSCMPGTVQAVQAIANTDHILYGSDYPYAPEVASKLTLRLLLEKGTLSKQEKMMIEYSNAAQLFPQFADIANTQKEIGSKST